MNYLAHAYLSFHQPEILVGNLISDFVKGKKKLGYEIGIQYGIALHRAIDEFTDSHYETKKAKQYFKPYYGLYAGAFVDIVYDHFLAKDPMEFSEGKLAAFSMESYTILRTKESVFPEKFRRMFHYMQLQDWFYNYQFPEMMAQSFRGLVHRAAYMNDSENAFFVFEKNYEQLKETYTAFFPSLKEFAFQKLQELTNH